MQTVFRRIMVVGATSAIAEQCCHHWVQEGAEELILLGRESARLRDLRQDLAIRYAELRLRVETLDVCQAAEVAERLDALFAAGPIDLVLIAHGELTDQEAAQRDLPRCANSLQLNGVSPVLFAERCASQMLQQGSGQIAIIGSVAGDRGRQSNYVYGAAKGLIERYVEGLQHRLAGTKVCVTLIKPGPTDTPMTAHLKAQGQKLARVEDVAASIVKGVRQQRAQIYTPAIWRWIMLIIRNLPRPILHRLKI